jgi:hypothetical protein
VGEVLQQQPQAGVRVLPPSQVRRPEVAEVDVLERPPGRAGVEAAEVAAKKLAKRPMAPLTARA